MSRPRLVIGTFGDITVRIMPSGQFMARTMYRDWDGQGRQVQATGNTAKAAERALKGKLSERNLLQPSNGHLTPDSPFPDLVKYWLDDIDAEGRISKTTRNLYERNMRTLVLPVFQYLTLREIGVVRCDQFIKQMAKLSYSRAKQSRVVLRLALELAVRHEILPTNPMDHVARLHREPHIPDALTAVEVNKIRLASIFEARAGLRPMSRLYVHLSDNPKAAILAGARRGAPVQLLRVDPKGASGLVFVGANTWLATAVKSTGLSVMTVVEQVALEAED
ncbi:hypothetical protein [Cryobacterium lyxosi]|uniref:hypothetical protein n=1 Tax=Cryobacterium lyxosi TaxID=1259228 RepID=UPI0018E073F2|nr:hypothetical protein [Cryobacterium lyxosi]